MVSVCVATYNGVRFIEEQLRSILACVDPADEVIISDDGSTDGTLDVLESFVSRYSNVRVICGPRRGLIANFDHLLSQAKGEVIFLSDQDDVWHIDKVQKVLEAFSSTHCDVVVHDAQLVDANGVPMGETLFGIRHSKSGLVKNLVKNSYVGCCMALRRDLLSTVRPIPEHIEMHDWWIGLIADSTAKTCFIDNVLLDYRRHDSNMSGMSHYPLAKMIRNRVVMLAELIKRVFRVGATEIR